MTPPQIAGTLERMHIRGLCRHPPIFLKIEILRAHHSHQQDSHLLMEPCEVSKGSFNMPGWG